MATITRDTGLEGPRHDPYVWTELSVARTSPGFTGEVTIHSGLETWVEANGERTEYYGEAADKEADEAFARLAGITSARAEAAYRELRGRRLRFHPCGEKFLEWKSGYPGEAFLICAKCGGFLDSSFDRSAIE